LHQKIEIGTKLFQGHGVANETEGRIPVAEVVAKKLKEINNRLTSLVTCWIYPDYQNLPLDVASIEAGIDIKSTDENNMYVTDVDKVTGIALGNSKVNTPGFPGATLQGVLQAFAEKLSPYQGGDMSLADIKKAVQEGRFQPSEIFGKDELLSDPFVMESTKEKINNATGYKIRQLEGENEAIKKTNEETEKKLKELENKFTEKETEVKTLKSETIKSKIPDIFEAQKKERKFDPEKDIQLINWLDKKIKSYVPQNPEEIDKEISKLIDSEIDEFKIYSSEVFGNKIEEKEEARPGGSEPGAEVKGKTEDKYIDPLQNPMINPTPGR
jgi:DNA-binding transcriptional MerR regulator